MTERLSQLLHDEATALVPPAPDTGAVLREGRRLRRRGRVTSGLAVAGVAALVAATVGVLAVTGGGNDERAVDPASPPGPSGPSHTAWATGSQVHVDGEVAQVPDTVHSLHFTSVGVLVRSNPHDGASDGSGPESLTLVRWDGTTADLGTVPEGVGPATDPTSDLYALAEARGDGFVAVLRDAETGEAVQEVALPDGAPSYWEVPPLGLDGGTLYVGYESETVALDLATGEGGPVAGLPGGIPDVHGGHSTAAPKGAITVVDVDSGEVLLRVETKGYAYGELSPDGRTLSVSREETIDAQGRFVTPDVLVYDVASGESRTFPGAAYDWGWTTGGDLLRVAGDTLTTCDPASGDCATEPVTPPLGRDAAVRLGGRTYES